MKAIHARSALHYRNDAVFRSAERLLAAPLARRGTRPSSRWLVFFAGLALGAFVGIMGWRYWITPSHSIPTINPSANAAPRTSAAKPANAPKFDPLAPPVPIVSPIQTATVTPLADYDADSTNSKLHLRSPASAATAMPSAVSNYSASVATWTTPPMSELTLRGELLTEESERIPFAVLLRRRADGSSNVVSGIARYFSGKNFVSAYELSGEFEGRIVRLHETEPVGVNSTTGPIGRQFLLVFPTEGTGEITGTWTRGSHSGTLVLHPTTPW